MAVILPVFVSGYHHFYVGGNVTKWQTIPVNITVDSDSAGGTSFQTQVQTATNTWNNISSARNVLGTNSLSTVDFTKDNLGTAWGRSDDTQNEVVYDADGEIIRELGVRSGNPQFNPARINGFAPTEKRPNGEIISGFVLINGSRTNFDRLSTLVHEFGHFQGLAHSSVGMHNSASFPSDARDPISLGSVPTMHPFSGNTGTGRQTLEPDDIASLSELYPEATFESSFSTIEGTVTRCPGSSTTAVTGANVRAINTSNPNIQLSRFTGFDNNTAGRYIIKGVPPGTYRLVIEPMGANDFTLNRFGSPPSSFESDFATEYLSAEADENGCAEELPDSSTNISATAGTTTSSKNFKVQNVKLALVIDDTGSMANEIVAVRTSLSAFITIVERITTTLGIPFPDVAIITFKDNVTQRIISNNPARLQAIVNGLTASGGDDCPESSVAALDSAGRLLRNGGVAVLVTDANSRPDGPKREAINIQYRAKGQRIFTLLSGDCSGSLLTGDGSNQEKSGEAMENCFINRMSENLDEFPLPETLGSESTVRTYSDISNGTGGFFTAIPGIKTTSNLVEKQRYINVATNLSVSSLVPAIGLINPGDGVRGRTFDVEILGSNTNFQGLSQISFGSGITVNSRTVNSPVRITANVTVTPDAVLGFRDVTVTTPLGASTTEEATGVGAINIVEPVATPTLISITPSSGGQGSTLDVSISGSNTNFVNGTSIANFGAGITVNSTTVINSTRAIANITVQNEAVIGFRDVIVTTSTEVARENVPGPFVVTPAGVVIPQVTAITPTQGERGRNLSVTVTGENTNFVNGVSVISFSGTGITVNNTIVNSAVSATANITIAANAALTFRDVIVTTSGEAAVGLGIFQVTPPLNAPPVCTGARPSVTLILPPDRRFVPVNILDVTDPDNDALTIGITTIRQDEPVDHIGDGSFVPDSTVNGSTALLRAESILGTVVVGGTSYVGNGRFYHVNFTATDTANNSCSGTVKVAVPHTRTATPIDGGALFNSITAQAARFSDFDGDRKTDLSVFREGEWHIRNTSNEQVGVFNFGLSGDRIVPADYDGDGKTDIAVYRNGSWWIIGANGTATVRQFGLAGDIPVPADYDGDGKDDLAVYRQGTWYLLQSSTGYAVLPFGLATDKPVPADYDGDGRTDIAVYRDGVWYLLRSAQGFIAFQFGLDADKPVPSDYDGDGRADPAVYRGGVWYLLRSAQGIAIFQFGLAADLPTPADYDGDGKTDVGVFRDGVWYSLNISTGQYRVVQFGTSNDRPIPSAFVP